MKGTREAGQARDRAVRVCFVSTPLRAKNDLKAEKDPFKRAVLDGRQLALKVGAAGMNTSWAGGARRGGGGVALGRAKGC